jgi:hypothetical protein
VDINTGIAIVNNSTNRANITYTLLSEDGSSIAAGQGTLDAGKHFGKFINQLNEVAPDFVVPADFQFASLDILSDHPLSITALRMTSNQRAGRFYRDDIPGGRCRPAGAFARHLPAYCGRRRI